MTAQVRLLDEAITELEYASVWYEEQRSGLGLVFLTAVDRTIDHLSRCPLAGALIDEIDESLDVRRITVGSSRTTSRTSQRTRASQFWRSLTNVDAPATGAVGPTDEVGEVRSILFDGGASNTHRERHALIAVDIASRSAGICVLGGRPDRIAVEFKPLERQQPEMPEPSLDRTARLAGSFGGRRLRCALIIERCIGADMPVKLRRRWRAEVAHLVGGSGVILCARYRVGSGAWAHCDVRASRQI